MVSVGYASRKRKLRVFFYPVVLLLLLVLYWSGKDKPAYTNRDILEAKGTRCLRNEFKNVVLIIAYNYALYSSIPLLRSLYQNAFPTIMFCGPIASDKYPVEGIISHRGYFSYVCMSLAMEKYPEHQGYLLINDDVLLNYWQVTGFDRAKIWEGPKAPITFHGYSPPEKWSWWNSTWGMRQCQKACDEIWALRDESQEIGWDLEQSFKALAENGGGKYHCYRGRSDIFYVPRRFSRAFQTMSYIFYKHGVFIEIAVPTICRMLDVVENVELIPGVYLPGRAGQPPVKNARYFWEVYNKTLGFVHPLKLNYKQLDATFNTARLKTWIMEYSNNLTRC